MLTFSLLRFFNVGLIINDTLSMLLGLRLERLCLSSESGSKSAENLF